MALGHNGECKPPGPHMCLLSDYGCHIAGVARRLAHAANTFLAELFALRPLGFGASAGALRMKQEEEQYYRGISVFSTLFLSVFTGNNKIMYRVSNS